MSRYGGWKGGNFFLISKEIYGEKSGIKHSGSWSGRNINMGLPLPWKPPSLSPLLLLEQSATVNARLGHAVLVHEMDRKGAFPSLRASVTHVCVHVFENMGASDLQAFALLKSGKKYKMFK
jgi:hypothetical protein